MEREMGSLGVDNLSHSRPSFQHQFFPGAGGMQPLHPNQAEHLNEGLSSINWDHNTVQGGVRPPHWDMKAWKWDSLRFVAQPTAGMGADSCEGARRHTVNENGVSHKAPETESGLNRPAGTEQQVNNNDDEPELRGRSFFGRETPSPSLNERRSSPPDDDSAEDVGSLILKLGGDSYAYAEENGNGSRNGKRNRSSSPQAQVPMCQVDACKADLSKAKDYHRRHKVCEMHSKAGKAPIARLMQRFCQQCSRFHPLQEFDEGKRSCRRRLAGHNRRRRKTQPEAAAALLAEERLGKGGTGLIGSLLNILSQLTGTASLDHGPVYDREALLRKAVSASLENINRTTPLWNQFLPTTNHLTSGFGQQLAPVATTNGHGVNLPMETQLLLSRLAGPSPEALLHLLQSSLSAQIAAASRTPQNTSVSHMHGGAGPGHLPLGSSCGSEAQRPFAGTSQACVDPTIAGVAHSLLSSPMPGRVSLNSEVVIPTAPAALPQLNAEQLTRQGYPAVAPSVQRSYPPNQAAVNQSTNRHLNNRQEAEMGGQSSTDGRMPSIFLPTRNPDSQSSFKAVPPSSRSQLELQQLPVPQISDNSQSGSDEQSPTSSNVHVEWRNRTRRISFKLFERTPEELPSNLRSQIDSWLAHLPSDMESYIRPGCLVLTIYVSMPTCGWMELDRDLRGSVEKLLKLCSDDFWHKGSILVQVEHQTIFVVDGDIRERRYLESWSHPYIQSVRPLAVEAGQSTTITFKGFNLSLSDTRLLCAYQGKYLLQRDLDEEHRQADDSSYESDEDNEDTNDDFGEADDYTAYDETSLCLDYNFTSCGEPQNTVGRCFVEVEHHITGGNTRPIIVADRSMCSELRKLEEEVESAAALTAQSAAKEGLQPVEVIGCIEVARLVVEDNIACFLHDLGWFFQRSSNWQQEDPSLSDRVLAIQLKCLLIFSVERNWCAVVRKLLDIACGHKNIDAAVARVSHAIRDEVSLLHRAVRKKNRQMVELLLAYVPSSLLPESVNNIENMENFGKLMQFKLQWGILFRPDMAGPAGLTPLHIAASMQDAEDVVDALTSDPFQVGLHAWVNKLDDSGQTPLYCAMAGRNFRSVHLVMDKLARLEAATQEVRINIPLSLPRTEGDASSSAVQLAVWVDSESVPVKNPNINRAAPTTCRTHARRSKQFGGIAGRAFRPFLLSLVGIAAVCVCVCLVFKGPPQVKFLLPPFRWEDVDSGPR